MGPDAGLAFLQHVIEFAETVVFVDGCSCGAKTLDFTIEAVVNSKGDVTSYVIECLACHRRTSVEADILEGYSAAQAQAAQPNSPPAEATCFTCSALVIQYTMTRNPKTGKLECAQCASVQKNIGEIVEITEKALLL